MPQRRPQHAVGGARHADPSGAAGHLKKQLLGEFTYTPCAWAWACIAVGSAEEAMRASEAADDLVAYAASLALSGDASRALLVLEAYIVAVCAVCYEVTATRVAEAADGVSRMQTLHSTSIAKWLHSGTGPNPSLRDVEFRQVMRTALRLIDWHSIMRWYIVALTLRADTGNNGPYTAPRNVWLRYFLGLFPQGFPFAGPFNGRPGENIPHHLETLGEQETLMVLLSQCPAAEVQLVSALTALHTQRYRSSLIFATRALAFMDEEALGGPAAGAERRMDGGRVLDRIAAHYLRCRAALEVGERPQALADMIHLFSQSAPAGTSDGGDTGAGLDRVAALYISGVGAALALYGAPLPEARAALVALLRDDDLALTARRYLLALAGYVHVLTLAQIGELEACTELATQLASWAPASLVTEDVYDLLVTCGVGLEDSTLILETPLSPHRLLYIALSPAFFGGLSGHGIRLKRDTDTFNLLYPAGFSSYMAVRQLLPFHMNRSFHFYAHGEYKDAWDEACCAVAAADEIVGSLCFAFTECFPLRVYFFGCQLALLLLDILFEDELAAVAACLRAKEDAVELDSAASAGGGGASSRAEVLDRLLASKVTVYGENNELAREVIEFARQWTLEIKKYYPRSVLGDIAEVRLAAMVNHKDMLQQAVWLARRYPASTLAQNTLTLALYSGHHISEAVDAAQKNFEDFPHAKDVKEIRRWLQTQKMVYVFNYRTLVPLRYKPGDGTRVFTKRMLIAIIFLVLHTANAVVLCALNLPKTMPLPEGANGLAVRLQLPSMVPMFFAAVCVVHAIMSSVTTNNLVGTFLCDNHFCNTPLSRFLFGFRGVALVTVVNALQISLAGNNFLFSYHIYTFLLYAVLTILIVPFTTRVWFLPSIDEPNVGVLSWLTILSVDTVIGFVILLPHMVLAVLEPYMCLVYYLFLPPHRPTEQNVSGSIRRRLLFHEQNRYTMPSRFSVVTNSRFIHVRVLSLLYWRSHSARETANLDQAQLEAEGFRAFPVVSLESAGLDTEAVLSRAGRDSGAFADAHLGCAAAAERMPMDEPLLAACGPVLLSALRDGKAAPTQHASPLEKASEDDSLSPTVQPLSRVSSQRSFRVKEEFEATLRVGGSLVGLVKTTLEDEESAAMSPCAAGARWLARGRASFVTAPNRNRSHGQTSSPSHDYGGSYGRGSPLFTRASRTVSFSPETLPDTPLVEPSAEPLPARHGLRRPTFTLDGVPEVRSVGGSGSGSGSGSSSDSGAGDDDDNISDELDETDKTPAPPVCAFTDGMTEHHYHHQEYHREQPAAPPSPAARGRPRPLMHTAFVGAGDLLGEPSPSPQRRPPPDSHSHAAPLPVQSPRRRFNPRYDPRFSANSDPSREGLSPRRPAAVPSEHYSYAYEDMFVGDGMDEYQNMFAFWNQPAATDAPTAAQSGRASPRPPQRSQPTNSPTLEDSDLHHDLLEEDDGDM